MPNFFARLIPFVLLGIAIVAFAFGLILLTYLFIFGAIVGLILFLINWIRAKFFPTKKMTKHNKPTGRTFDQEK